MLLKLPLIIVAVFGLFMLVQFFVEAPFLDHTYQEILDWVQIIYLFTLWVGAINLIKLHLKKSTHKKEAPYSVVTLSGIVIMLFFLEKYIIFSKRLFILYIINIIFLLIPALLKYLL